MKTTDPTNMKTRFTMLKFLIILCITFATTAAFGQTTYTWTNQYCALLPNTTGGDMNQSTNWTPNGFPRSDSGPDPVSGWYGDLVLFDGRTTGAIVISESGNNPSPGYGFSSGGGSGNPLGARIEVTSLQTSPVQIVSVGGTSGGLRMNWFTVDAGTGSLILGDHNNSGNVLDIVGGTLNGQVLGFTNNSSVTCVVNESTRYRMGGAGSHPFVL